MADSGRSAAQVVVVGGASAAAAFPFTGAVTQDLPTVALFGASDTTIPIRGLMAGPLIALKVRDSGQVEWIGKSAAVVV